MPLPTEPKFYRLASPWGKAPVDGLRVQCNIPRDVYHTLVNGILGGVYNVQLSLISSFLHKLLTKCDELKLPHCYDPDNEHRVAKLINQLNFDDLDAVRADAYRQGYNAAVATGGAGSKDSVRRGAAPQPAGNKPGRVKSGGRSTVRKGTPQSPNVGTDLPSDAAGRGSGDREETTGQENNSGEAAR